MLQPCDGLAGGLDNSSVLRHVDRPLGCVGLVMLLGHGFSGPKPPACWQCLRPSETEVSQQDSKSAQSVRAQKSEHVCQRYVGLGIMEKLVVPIAIPAHLRGRVDAVGECARLVGVGDA